MKVMSLETKARKTIASSAAAAVTILPVRWSPTATARVLSPVVS